MLVKKLTAGIATAAMLGTFLAPAAFAQITVTNNGNGAGSTQVIGVSNSFSHEVTQTNSSLIITGVTHTNNTGGNNSSFNTGGDSLISTGTASSDTSVSIGGSSNGAAAPSCGCNNPITVNNNNNGASSNQTIGVTQTFSHEVSQSNDSTILTTVEHSNTSGNNTSSFNTGPGTSAIGTGGSSSSTTINVTGSQNVSL